MLTLWLNFKTSFVTNRKRCLWNVYVGFMKECTGVKRHLLLSSLFMQFQKYATKTLNPYHLTRQNTNISPPDGFTVQSELAQTTWSFISIIYHISKNGIVQIKVENVNAWNMSQMARICMRFVHAEYFSDKSRLRYDMTNKQSSHELSNLAPHRNQGCQSTFM